MKRSILVWWLTLFLTSSHVHANPEDAHESPESSSVENSTKHPATASEPKPTRKYCYSLRMLMGGVTATAVAAGLWGIQERKHLATERLVAAVRLNKKDEVESALRAGANIHHKNDDALRWAAYLGRIEIVELLLDHGADIHAVNDEALIHAVEGGNATLIELLLDRGANIHARNDQPLRYAVVSEPNLVKLLLDRGADVHAMNDSAICFRPHSAYLETLKLLLDRGANVHSHNEQPLAYAVDHENLEAAKLLLDRGADVRARSFLTMAAHGGGMDMAKLLLDRGADIQAPDHTGRTALHWATFKRHPSLVQFLLDKEANIHARDKEGQTALDLAVKYQFVEIENILRSRINNKGNK